MTILNALMAPGCRRVFVGADTGALGPAGPEDNVTKLWLLPNAHAVLGGRGLSDFTMGVGIACQNMLGDFDWITAQMADVLERTTANCAATVGKYPHIQEILCRYPGADTNQIAIAGYSPRLKRLSLNGYRQQEDGTFESNLDIEYFTSPFEAKWELRSPPATRAEFALLAQQQKIKLDHEYPGHGSGGRFLAVELTAQQMTVSTWFTFPHA